VYKCIQYTADDVEIFVVHPSNWYRILKIGSHLPKLLSNVELHTFLRHSV